MRVRAAFRVVAVIAWVIAGWVVLASDASDRTKDLAIFISATLALAALYAGPRSSRS